MAELLDDLARSWARDLRAAGKPKSTIEVYLRAPRQFGDWCLAQGRPATEESLTKHAISAWLAHLADLGRAGATLLVRHIAMGIFTKWLVAEEVLAADPMATLKRPVAKPPPVPLISDADVAKLLKACEGKSFEDRRDQALIRVLFDCGTRISECANLELANVNLDLDVISVHGKGDQWRSIPFGAKTGRALDRYLRARRAHQVADTTNRLWLGTRGPYGDDGIKYTLDKRARQAGIDHIHAHQFRHGFAHNWLLAGGQERDLKRLAGWKSDAMLARYGASAAEERAREAAHRMRLGDRL